MSALTKDQVAGLASTWTQGIHDGKQRGFEAFLRSMLDQGPVVFRFNLDHVKADEDYPPCCCHLGDGIRAWIYDKAVRLGHTSYRKALELQFGPLHSEYFNARFFLGVEEYFADIPIDCNFEIALEEACSLFGVTLQTREIAV